MKRTMIGFALIIAIVIGLWHSTSAVPPYYRGLGGGIRGSVVIDPMLEMARGNVEGVTVVSVFGRNFDIDAIADIWDKGEVGGTLIYVAPTQARLHAIVSSDATDVTSSCELTLTGQPSPADTCTIGTKVYIFQDTLTDVDGNVHIDHTNAEGTIDNLVVAVNLGAGSGTDYAASMTANDANVIAVKTAANDFTIYTVTSTAIATTQSMTNATWNNTTTTLGTGARTLRVTGLTDWKTREVSEVISMRGLSNVTTTNSYVLIHRMEVLTKGATKVNTGSIDATAATDSSISARIRAEQGQTHMAIYGVPSTQTAYMRSFSATVNKEVATGYVDISLLVNPEPDDEEKMFIFKHTHGLRTAGSSHFDHDLKYDPVPGPAIIKVQCDSGTSTMDITAGFDLILVDN